jgi:folylpolyglutamate synthase/dihydropteroate synthase
VIATTVHAARAIPAVELAARWRARGRDVGDVLVRPDPVEAVEAGLAIARRVSGATVVAGSLYLVGAVRAHLVDDPELRDPPSR